MSVSVGKRIISYSTTNNLNSLCRYLRASKWKTHVAIQRLESTLKWRREYGIYDTLTSDLVSVEVRAHFSSKGSSLSFQ